ncbi:hypothetical protein MMC13_004002 [Lambiella insularis]|nr:hypothetical protein [Lambiella insularis]
MGVPQPTQKNRKRGQQDVNIEKSFQRGRGMSMDIGNPYLLPPGLQSSRESLHSLSRTLQAGHDPYRPATTYSPSDASVQSYSNPSRGGDDSSSYTGSSGRGYKTNASSLNLVQNAQNMPQSQPPIQGQGRAPAQVQQSSRSGLSANSQDSLQQKPRAIVRDSYTVKDGADLRRSNNYLANFIHSRDPSVDTTLKSTPQQTIPKQNNRDLPLLPSTQEHVEDQNITSSTLDIRNDAVSRPPRNESLSTKALPQVRVSDRSDQDRHEYVENTVPRPDDFRNAVMQNYPGQSIPTSEAATPFYTPTEEQPRSHEGGLEIADMDMDNRRISIVRPLPPDDPTDVNPEQRANRIRSFYKEYFNDSEPARAYAPVPATYYEDYGQEFLGEGAIFDPVSGRYVVAQAPFAEPVTRRAMTPPPRAPPRFQGQGQHSYNSSNAGPMGPPRSRAYSSASASGRFEAPARGRGPPKRAMPPPGPLRTLPTPHLLQEDAFVLPIDFAPPSSYKDRRAGRSQSPRMQARPYSPSVRSHTPLATAFEELPVMPSPHQLREFGAFTALDFAPPPRFKNSDAGSDAGSVRSGRSGRSNGSAMSAAQMHSIRSGAYRVSRIPKEMVGTKEELAGALKPQWNLNR